MTTATVSAEPCAPPSARVVSIRVDATSYSDAVVRILAWAERRESRYVCVATVNNVMQAYDDRSFRAVMNAADLVTPDGMPLVWALRLFGIHAAARVYGPDLMRALLAEAERTNTPVALYGGTADALHRLAISVESLHPELKIAYRWSPPFRPLTAEEDAAVIRGINESGAAIVFVGLSTPKQECWMAAHRGAVFAPMIGVGAAFDFLSGSKPQAPRWMMRSGLEWSFRLVTEPRRLWRRYLAQNPRYVALFTADWIARCLRRRNRGAIP